MKAESIHVGDFVYCRSKYHRNQLELPAQPGLVIEVKGTNIKVLYGRDKRCWLPRETITRLANEADPITLAGRLHYLIKRVRAVECELHSNAGVHKLSLRIDRIDLETIDDMRRFLGNDLLSFSISPEGMAFMLAEIQFREGG